MRGMVSQWNGARFSVRDWIRVTGILALAVAAACSRDDRSSREVDSPATDEPSDASDATRHEVSAVQLGAFADSSAAARMRDSLAAAGWRASTTAGTSGGQTVWRVRVGASPSPALPRLVAHVLAAAGREAIVVRDSATASEMTGRLIPVNNGTHGMAAVARWALSPDRRAMLVVEDPAAVEAEPIPNGFVLASEDGSLTVQRDSVWDVSPSGDWKRLAYGRAAGAFARGGTELSEAQWRTMARTIGLDEAVVRRESFSISGMNYAAGIARAAVLDLSGGDAPEARDLPVAAGWRVRWLASGEGLALGKAPKSVQDYSPPSSWIVVDPRTGAVRDTLPAAPASPSSGDGEPPDPRFVDVGWTEGPTLDVSVTIDMAAERALPVDGGRIISGNGWIRREGSAGGAGRIIGPGTVLAATRGGRYVAALAPAPDAREYEAKVQLVVYEVP